MKLIAIGLLFLFARAVSASPCDGVNRFLSENQKNHFSQIIAKQLNIDSAEILQSFHYRNWYVIYVSTHVSDESFLFFDGDPLQRKYLTLWSGSAARHEGPEIKSWAFKNAKGIPSKLAECFAWYVVEGRSL